MCVVGYTVCDLIIAIVIIVAPVIICALGCVSQNFGSFYVFEWPSCGGFCSQVTRICCTQIIKNNEACSSAL